MNNRTNSILFHEKNEFNFENKALFKKIVNSIPIKYSHYPKKINNQPYKPIKRINNDQKSLRNNKKKQLFINTQLNDNYNTCKNQDEYSENYLKIPLSKKNSLNKNCRNYNENYSPIHHSEHINFLSYQNKIPNYQTLNKKEANISNNKIDRNYFQNKNNSSPTNYYSNRNNSFDVFVNNGIINNMYSHYFKKQNDLFGDSKLYQIDNRHNLNYDLIRNLIQSNNNQPTNDNKQFIKNKENLLDGNHKIKNFNQFLNGDNLTKNEIYCRNQNDYINKLISNSSNCNINDCNYFYDSNNNSFNYNNKSFGSNICLTNEGYSNNKKNSIIPTINKMTSNSISTNLISDKFTFNKINKVCKSNNPNNMKKIRYHQSYNNICDTNFINKNNEYNINNSNNSFNYFSNLNLKTKERCYLIGNDMKISPIQIMNNNKNKKQIIGSKCKINEMKRNSLITSSSSSPSSSDELSLLATELADVMKKRKKNVKNGKESFKKCGNYSTNQISYGKKMNICNNNKNRSYQTVDQKPFLKPILGGVQVGSNNPLKRNISFIKLSKDNNNNNDKTKISKNNSCNNILMAHNDDINAGLISFQFLSPIQCSKNSNKIPKNPHLEQYKSIKCYNNYQNKEKNSIINTESNRNNMNNKREKENDKGNSIINNDFINENKIKRIFYFKKDETNSKDPSKIIDVSKANVDCKNNNNNVIIISLNKDKNVIIQKKGSINSNNKTNENQDNIANGLQINQRINNDKKSDELQIINNLDINQAINDDKKENDNKMKDSINKDIKVNESINDGTEKELLIIEQIMREVENKEKNRVQRHIQFNLDENITIKYKKKELITKNEVFKQDKKIKENKGEDKDMELYNALLKSKTKYNPVIKNYDKKDIKINDKYQNVENLEEYEIFNELYNIFYAKSINAIELDLKNTVNSIMSLYDLDDYSCED